MDITVKTVGQITVVEIYGSIDENTTPEAQAVILSRAQPGCKMALDLGRVSFLIEGAVKLLANWPKNLKIEDVWLTPGAT